MLKVVITGPESSGKTTLAAQLAAHFKAPLVREYARIFFNEKQSPQYVQEDLVDIAKGQINEETTWLNHMSDSNANKLSPLLICDTDLLTIKIWSNEVFSNISLELSQVIDSQIISTNIRSLYLLCSPQDIPWEFDILRENPDDRDRLFDVYEKELMFYNKNYRTLRGDFQERLKAAVQIITPFLTEI